MWARSSFSPSVDVAVCKGVSNYDLAEGSTLQHHVSWSLSKNRDLIESGCVIHNMVAPYLLNLPTQVVCEGDSPGAARSSWLKLEMGP